jgi:FkbM family methyltransferase
MTDNADASLRSGAPAYDSTEIGLGDGPMRKLYYRNQTTDKAVIQQILVNKQYELGRLRRSSELRGYLAAKRTTGKAPLIIDAGANIGIAALFFRTMVPDAKIVAVEPEPDNFTLLQLNVTGLSVETMRGALSATEGRARVVDPGLGHWGYRTEAVENDAATATAVPRLTVNQIYRQHAARCFPFIVKIDIEGGEADLFSANTEWVAATPIVIIELHDWLLTKRGISRAFLNCVSQLDRDFVYLGEDVYSIANDL